MLGKLRSETKGPIVTASLIWGREEQEETIFIAAAFVFNGTLDSIESAVGREN